MTDKKSEGVTGWVWEGTYAVAEDNFVIYKNKARLNPEIHWKQVRITPVTEPDPAIQHIRNLLEVITNLEGGMHWGYNDPPEQVKSAEEFIGKEQTDGQEAKPGTG